MLEVGEYEMFEEINAQMTGKGLKRLYWYLPPYKMESNISITFMPSILYVKDYTIHLACCLYIINIPIPLSLGNNVSANQVFLLGLWLLRQRFVIPKVAGVCYIYINIGYIVWWHHNILTIFVSSFLSVKPRNEQNVPTMMRS